MAKRFTATEIWEEDWFLEMPNEYKLFWYYMLSNCDHAGVYKVNLRSFSSLLEVKVSSAMALTYFNVGKQRIRTISEGLWFIEDFFVYQYGHTFNSNNRLHSSIFIIWQKHKIDLTSIRGLLEVKDGVKEKDKVSSSFTENTNSLNTENQKKTENGKANKPINDYKASGAGLYDDRLNGKIQNF